jgi:hypothetical protein
LFSGSLADRVHGLVKMCSAAAFAFAHQPIDEFRDQNAVELRIGQNLAFIALFLRIFL